MTANPFPRNFACREADQIGGLDTGPDVEPGSPSSASNALEHPFVVGAQQSPLALGQTRLD
ncbi:MAG: hypothetical protein P8014_20085, partial [Acidihalobacter sp.]|uniref:hypothetical protein n=1 Tax=Acidihalobacter sp. TaxID=1872108 RepID=UPI00307EADF7